MPRDREGAWLDASASSYTGAEIGVLTNVSEKRLLAEVVSRILDRC